MKLTKKKKNILVGVFIISAILILSYLAQNKFAVFNESSIGILTTKSEIISSSDKSTIYKWSFTAQGIPITSFSGESVDIGLGKESGLIDNRISLIMNPNYNNEQEGIDFNASQIILRDIGGIIDYQSDNTRLASKIDFSNIKAICNVVKKPLIACNGCDDLSQVSDLSPRIVLSCLIQGEISLLDENNIKKSGAISGLTNGDVTVEILKNGVQCTSTQLSLCAPNQTCSNNQCTDVQTPSQAPPSQQPIVIVTLNSTIGGTDVGAGVINPPAPYSSPPASGSCPTYSVAGCLNQTSQNQSSAKETPSETPSKTPSKIPIIYGSIIAIILFILLIFIIRKGLKKR